MFWPGGLFALELTTSTPDALCPPLEEARAAVSARVGDVRGEFHVEFALIRTDDGRQVLDLVMSNAKERVLHRELPLDGAGCQDAAQAIALVLERYFDAVESPTPPATVSKMEPVPVTTHSPAAPMDRPPTDAPPREALHEDSRRPFRLALGSLYDANLGFAPLLAAGVYPASLQLTSQLALGLELMFAPFVSARIERLRQQELTENTVQGALFVPLELAKSRFRAAVGPWAQLRWQTAEAPSLANEQSGSRWLPGFGGAARVGYSPWSRWTASLGLAGGAQLTSVADRFSLRRESGEPLVVLDPQRWFAQGELRISLEL